MRLINLFRIRARVIPSTYKQFSEEGVSIHEGYVATDPEKSGFTIGQIVRLVERAWSLNGDYEVEVQLIEEVEPAPIYLDGETNGIVYFLPVTRKEEGGKLTAEKK